MSVTGWSVSHTYLYILCKLATGWMVQESYSVGGEIFRIRPERPTILLRDR